MIGDVTSSTSGQIYTLSADQWNFKTRLGKPNKKLGCCSLLLAKDLELKENTTQAVAAVIKKRDQVFV